MTKWNQFITNFSDNEILIRTLWKELESEYTHKNRHYHNLDHIRNMLSQFQQHRDNLRSPEAVQFAIWYHDIIYKATRSDNEEKSAEVAQKRLMQLDVPIPIIQKCHDLIIATKTHQSGTGDPDFDYLLDFDLSILGAGWEPYFSYTQNIRKEYAIYPDFMYKKGRKKVLQHFLATASIFKTPYYKEQFEKIARSNLDKELGLL